MRDIVETVAELDRAPSLHAARLLILLHAFAGPHGQGSIDGLTKLAKLDFLLRYPVMLERALKARSRSTREVRLETHERQSVESQMVRYRFGPWDHRYRMFLNVLVGKGLASISLEGRTIVITLTESGFKCGCELATEAVFEPYVRRAKLLKNHLDLTATHLMRFIYDTFPEVVTLRSNELIPT